MYFLQQANNPVALPTFSDSGLGTLEPDPGTLTTRDVDSVISASLFYRVEAIVPLAP